MIYNDQNYNYGVYSGERTGNTVVVNGSYVVIRFHSDKDFQLRGFLLFFTAVKIGKYRKAGSPSLNIHSGYENENQRSNAIFSNR